MKTAALSSSLVAAVLLGLAGFASTGYAGGAWLILAGSLVFTALLLASPSPAQRVLRRPSSLRRAIAQLAEIPLAARLRNLTIVALAFTVMWFLMGASFYLLLVAADPHLDGALLKVAIGVSTLSWLVGFLAPFSPGGIGVREGAIVLLLNGLVPGPQATLVALLPRVLALAVELAFVAAAWLALRSARSPHYPAAWPKASQGR